MAHSLTVMLLFLGIGTSALAETARQLYTELQDARGVHPFAQLVCFPEPGQGQDTTFILVAFSKDIAARLRASGKPVPKELLDAEKAPPKDRLLMQWAFRNGVRLLPDPEVLEAIGDSGSMWSADFEPDPHKVTKKLRVVFSRSGRYSRDVFVDGKLYLSVYGRCEPIDK